MPRKTLQNKPIPLPGVRKSVKSPVLRTQDAAALPEKNTLNSPPPVTITTVEGDVFEIEDAPAHPGHITALASEQTLRKFWDNPQEEEAWQRIVEEM